MDHSRLPRFDSSHLLGKDNLPTIQDALVSKMLFLAVSPEYISGGKENQFLDPDDEPSYIDMIIEKFQKTLIEKNLKEAQKLVKLKLLTLRECSSPTLPMLETNFSDEDDNLTQEEQDILVFNEVLQMMNIQVPQALKQSFEVIAKSKRIIISENQKDDDHFNSFFIHTENKTLCEISDLLKPEDVFRMYKIIKEDKEDNKVQCLNAVREMEIDLESLESIVGLKDAAFYFILVNMMKEERLNRLHTHILESYLNELNTLYKSEKREQGDTRLQDAIDKLKRYPVTAHRPGICLIFCMLKDREGAEYDLKAVKNLFVKKFRYDVLVKVDPSAKEIQTVISKLRAPRNKFYDSLVVWFMGHGSSKDLQVKNKEKIHRKTGFIEPFTEIEWLNKKPKLIFIQACAVKAEKPPRRSSSAIWAEVDSLRLTDTAGNEWADKYGEHMDMSSVNNFADTLIAYATKWYEEATRSKKGSLYVDTVVDCLEKFGQTESIENVMRRVHYNVNTVALRTEDEDCFKQAPYIESSLQKEFVFPQNEGDK